MEMKIDWGILECMIWINVLFCIDIGWKLFKVRLYSMVVWCNLVKDDCK